MTRSLRVALGLSGLGHLIRNAEEFGLGPLFLAQSVVPLAITAAFLRAARRPTRRSLELLGTWGVIVVVAGGDSVFPWPFLPSCQLRRPATTPHTSSTHCSGSPTSF